MLLACKKWLWKGDFHCPPFLMLSFLELCCLRECFCLKTHGNSPNLNSKNMAHRHRRACNYAAETKNSCSLSLFCWAPWPQSIRLFFFVNCWRGSIIGCFFNLKGMSGVANFLLRWRCFSCVLPCVASQQIWRWGSNKNSSKVSIHPDPSQQNVIVTGCSNKKAHFWRVWALVGVFEKGHIFSTKSASDFLQGIVGIVV